ncbi:putative tyrosyl-tRNA synthetase [Monocercomonoides exilis]|uniref:putative tyrosyl-tRNA synthetase n=1 Tax=Monocercomonoides exilis TaxID=2049356 RepID=UPI00355A84FB|nr:putative tyrosyl-tRNA synthetase [Monocercomonoides exilis]|eukprot:MONOS_2611.1-p1 / transcript=MONOS_2611.1 / gene=MONOS_2611 / organism=Monocercomonoides_exilis_PA203 / gene_product=tyrosyl-tRNA synthetases / transcript_product=tyrosyl-tRNA synthetases / location=Mono_scaffold00055:20454-22129(+) / protein_length=392 / sequence_SO=supercontig / SO=protein_coding / is_pseudo=false
MATNSLHTLFRDSPELSELEKLAASSESKIVFDIVEPNGSMSLPQAILKAHIMKILVQCGFKIVLYIGDWLAFLHKKHTGNLQSIQTIGKYYIEVWKALGVPFGENIQIVWMKEAVGENPIYWEQMIDFSQVFTAVKLKTVSQQMENLKENSLLASHIMSPCLSCANMFFTETHCACSSSASASSTESAPSRRLADVIQIGRDQEQITDLLKTYCTKKGIKQPIIVDQHMLLSLSNPKEVMTKKTPASTIFVEETTDEIKKKMKKAFLAPDLEEPSGVIDLIFNLIIPIIGEFKIGEKNVKTMSELKEVVADGSVSLGAVKESVADAINFLLEPVHRHFSPDASEELQKLHQEVMLILHPPKPVTVKKEKKKGERPPKPQPKVEAKAEEGK